MSLLTVFTFKLHYVNPSGILYGEQFRYCLETFGADHITWGEDYPYRRKDDIRRFLENFDLSEEDKEKIAHGNAERLLHIRFRWEVNQMSRMEEVGY